MISIRKFLLCNLLIAIAIIIAVVALSDYYLSQHIQHIALGEIIIAIFTLLLSSLLVWLIIRKGLHSIRCVAREVSHRAPDHLDPVDLENVPTEIKPLIDELNKLFLRLKQAFEREQRFAADAAHELRTPLAALKTSAQVALRAPDVRECQIQLQKLIIGVDRCTHVVQQLLTLCRMGHDSVALENPTEVDLSKVATEVIGQLAPAAVDKKIEIELVATDPHCVIMGNPTAIYALLRNLVDNAIRYTPSEGTIKVFINNVGKEIVLRVIDNGPGIPAELRARVFERFFRVLGTNAQGSGLGLAIVQQIVKLHKGQISLSVPANGVGLEVEVRLPRSSKTFH